MLLGFADDVNGIGDGEALAGDANGGMDQGDLSLGKLAVDGGSGYLDDASDNNSISGCHKRFTPQRRRR
nr:hypothetical protein [uncultured bacterium]